MRIYNFVPCELLKDRLKLLKYPKDEPDDKWENKQMETIILWLINTMCIFLVYVFWGVIIYLFFGFVLMERYSIKLE